MKSIAGLSLLLCLTALSGCSGLVGAIEINVHVDCPVLGKKLRLADDGKAWLSRAEAREPSPPSVIDFTNAVGRFNEKVDEICLEKKP